MHSFIVFYAPFIILILSIVIAFLVADRDGSVRKEDE